MARTCGRACGMALLVASVLFIALFGYTVYAFAKYTPIYRPIQCESLWSRMGGIETNFETMTAGTTGRSQKLCRNPNPYPVTVRQADEPAAGTVFVRDGADLKEVGTSSIDEVHFAAGGSANMTANLKLELPAEEIFDLALKDKLQAVATFKALATASIEYLGLWVDMDLIEDQVCGFEVRLAAQQVGGAACALSLDRLVVPSIDNPKVYDRLELSPENRQSRGLLKNAFLAAVLVTTFGLALGSGRFGATALRRARGGEGARGAKGPEAAQGETVGKDAVACMGPSSQTEAKMEV
uniref:Uncharacterized protein n=1 Tax=Zooxanthella nutricula TaxID=1333877 RepID=A0A7S2HKH9_9DINO